MDDDREREELDRQMTALFRAATVPAARPFRWSAAHPAPGPFARLAALLRPVPARVALAAALVALAFAPILFLPVPDEGFSAGLARLERLLPAPPAIPDALAPALGDACALDAWSIVGSRSAARVEWPESLDGAVAPEPVDSLCPTTKTFYIIGG